MADERTHNVTTGDGVTIAGTVLGQGPPIVFWHGAYGDGPLDWGRLVHHVRGFSCHLPSWRGRGLSDDHPDLSYDRRVGDVLSYVESLDEPVGLVGWSGGASPAVAAASQSHFVHALAVFEPTIGSVMTDHERVDFGGAVARMAELAQQGEMTDAVRAAARFPFNDEELQIADDVGYFKAAGRYVPNLLDVLQQLRGHEGPTADDPVVLAAISIPVLVVHGSDTRPFWIRSAQHIATHVPNARTQQIPAAGHAAPLTHPGELAEALIRFFSPLWPAAIR